MHVTCTLYSTRLLACVRHFVRLASNRDGGQLVSETDAEHGYDRDARFLAKVRERRTVESAQVLDRLLAVLGVTGTVGYEDAIKFYSTNVFDLVISYM